MILRTLLFALAVSAGAKTGIALYPMSEHGKVVVKAGSIVEYTEDRNRGAIVSFQGKEILAYGSIIPLDPDFAPSRIYIELQQTRQSTKDIATLEGLVDLADAALKAFPRSPTLEHIEAQDVLLTYQLNNYRTEGKTRSADALTKARRYMIHYPEGKDRDELEWKTVLWTNEVYEIEGEAAIPLRQARAYEKFFDLHPASTYSEEIREHMADSYRLGGDLLDYGPDAKQHGPGEPYRAKAKGIYESLLKSKDPVRAAKALVTLYNLHHGHVPGFMTPTSPPMDW